jgi:zinc/manganese transport system ATP-binding protein
MAAIILDDVTLGHGGKRAVRRLSGVFEAGLATAVIGPNGSGKSTLLRAIAQDRFIEAGQIRLEGLRRRDIVYLDQDPGLDRAFPITTEDMIALGFTRRLGLFAGLGAPEREALAEALSMTGLMGLEHRPIASLSGGQFQRALFARLAIQDASAVLLDEPFSALDVRTTEDLAGSIRRWSDQGRIVVMVSHDFDLVRRFCPQTLILSRDVVAWGATEAVLTEENLAIAETISRRWLDAEAT